MAQVLVTEQHLMDTADAIRNKLGVQTTYKPREFPAAIASIPTGGGPSATAHSIYLEFSDGTDATIPVYYDDAVIGAMITAYTPATYGGKTVTLALLDGVPWYERVSREVIVPEQTITTTSDYTRLTYNSGLIVGETYIYTINGVEYTGIAQEQYGYIMLGQWSMYQDGTGGIFDYSSGLMYFDTKGRSTYTVKVERAVA